MSEIEERLRADRIELQRVSEFQTAVAAVAKLQKRIADLEAALADVVGSYEDARERIRAGTADRPSVSGQTFINRAKALLAEP